MTSNEPAVVLVVDDEPSICWGFQRLLESPGYKVLTASSAEEGLKKADGHEISLVLLDVRLPGEDGISALPKFLKATGQAPVVVMTAFGDLEIAVAAIHGGAYDYLTKPFRLEDAERVCRQAIRRHADRDDGGESAAESGGAADPAAATALVGRSTQMQQVFRQIALVADSDLSVLVTGETGTGKELVAAAIHRHSRRSDKPYVPVAPVTFNESVLESELFGHVRGAFTGASEDRKGLFELADGGTVLLDEIGDLNMGAQVKLLRVIEQGEFTAVGDVKPRKCNVRVVAATHQDLQAKVADGTFREDLLYRLAAVSIHLPPLRKRAEDVPSLCDYFLRRMGCPNPHQVLDGALRDELQQRPWYGNVRELRNAVEHAFVVARGRRLELSDFPEPRPRLGPRARPAASIDAVCESWTRKQLDEQGDEISDLQDRFSAATEPALLRVALEYTGGNRVAAAQLLGIHRGTLRDRIKRYGISDDSN